MKACEVLLTAGCKAVAGEVLVTDEGKPKVASCEILASARKSLVTVGEVLVTVGGKPSCIL